MPIEIIFFLVINGFLIGGIIYHLLSTDPQRRPFEEVLHSDMPDHYPELDLPAGIRKPYENER